MWVGLCVEGLAEKFCFNLRLGSEFCFSRREFVRIPLHFGEMGSKVAATSLHWSQTSLPHSPSSSRAVASAIASPSSERRRFVPGAASLFCQYTEGSALFLGFRQFSKLQSSRSCDNPRSPIRSIRRALSSNMDSFSDEEFSKKMEELALKFQLIEDGEDLCSTAGESETTTGADCHGEVAKFMENPMPFDALEPSGFPARDEIIPATIEWKANSVDIPLSLRIIKRKKQWQEGFTVAGESAVNKAFSSMVFIIRELHSYTLQMRQALFYEDLRDIFERVQKEMHASFVWLFQKVFSQTPTLMVHVMILLANYSVYSMSSNAAIAACTVTTEEVSVVEDQSSQKFDSSIVRTLDLSSSSGKTASVGGGGDGKYKPVASGTEGDGKFDGLNYHPMRARDESLDHETIQISPVNAETEADDYSDQLRTEMQYEIQLAQEPNNPLLLANFAQFLYLVAKDYDRAEGYFKRAANVEPKDGEALNKYANFLWAARDDLWVAEETFLEAIAAEPENPYYAASYANFLWNTGGEDTCFPLD